MIPRYTRPEMGKIWEDQNKFQIWLDIEVLACEAQAELGVIPQSAVEVIREKAAFEVSRIDEIEREVKHDVIAFLTNVAEHVGPDSRFIHLGMTSSDILDTCAFLLNTDTLVMYGWLDDLQLCALSDPKIRAVVPLPHSATFQSVPLGLDESGDEV